MNNKEFRKLDPKPGDTVVFLGEKKIEVKEVIDYGHWIHIIDITGFNYTAKDVVDIIKR